MHINLPAFFLQLLKKEMYVLPIKAGVAAVSEDGDMPSLFIACEVLTLSRREAVRFRLEK